MDITYIIMTYTDNYTCFSLLAAKKIMLEITCIIISLLFIN